MLYYILQQHTLLSYRLLRGRAIYLLVVKVALYLRKHICSKSYIIFINLYPFFSPSLYTYIYICMYVCMYVYIYIYTHYICSIVTAVLQAPSRARSRRPPPSPSAPRVRANLYTKN